MPRRQKLFEVRIEYNCSSEYEHDCHFLIWETTLRKAQKYGEAILRHDEGFRWNSEDKAFVNTDISHLNQNARVEASEVYAIYVQNGPPILAKDIYAFIRT